MAKIGRSIATALVLIFLLAGVSGCKKKGPMEKAGREIDKAAEKSAKELNKAVQKVGESMEKAGEKIKDSVK